MAIVKRFGKKGGYPMNRQQRRLKEQRHLNRVEEKIKLDGAKLAIDVLSVLPAYALAEEFNFGQKRLMRFMSRFIKTYDAVIKKQVTLETLAEIIKDKGVDIDVSGSGEWKVCKRRYIRKENEK